jgi:GTP-binding protein HflX
LVLHVSDAASPIAAEQSAQVESVLRELEADKKPRLNVVNKIDLLPPVQRQSLRDSDDTIHISAAKGIGLGALLERIDHVLQEDPLGRVQVQVPQREGKLLAQLEAQSRIFARRYRDGMVEMDVQAPESVLRKLRPFTK